MSQPPRVLFVCLGNICRSPSAEGVFRAVAEEADLAVEIDSAGTSNWHIGEPPDPRSQAAAARRGIDLSGLRGRQVSPADFNVFDLIIGMDRSNLARLNAMAPKGARADVRLFLDYAPGMAGREVPDPYDGGEQGFENVLDMIEAASKGLVAELQR